MIPVAIISLDNLDTAVSANGTLYSRFFFVEQLLGCAVSFESVLTHVSQRRGGIAPENLIDHFDRVAVLQRLKRARDPLYLHI